MVTCSFLLPYSVQTYISRCFFLSNGSAEQQHQTPSMLLAHASEVADVKVEVSTSGTEVASDAPLSPRHVVPSAVYPGYNILFLVNVRLTVMRKYSM